MALMWGLLAGVLLYILKTLYEINRTSLGETEDAVMQYSHEKSSVPTACNIDVSQKIAHGNSFSKPFPRMKEDRLKEAEVFSERNDIDSDFSLMVIKESIPETEYIDLDCFVYFKGARLLVVDDNILNQKIIKTVLKQSGIEIDIAENGKVALKYLLKKKREYDLVLMDISMPEMDGITTTKMIRSMSSRFTHLPIVSFTAFNLGAEIEAMFDAGANAYLTKPLNVAQLYTVFMLFIGNVNREISLEKILEIQGLDIKRGLKNADGDEMVYTERLRHFIYRYSTSVDQIPAWIEAERYDRLRLECSDMLLLLNQIGAYDMYETVQEMQLQFIYKNEYLLAKSKLLYRTKMKVLIDAINTYFEKWSVNPHGTHPE